MAVSFKRGCGLGFSAACENLRTLLTGGVFAVAPPALRDYPDRVEGKQGGDRRPGAVGLITLRACDQGWPDTCR